MANYRQIHVSIWRDVWFLELTPQEKLLFIYLISNDQSNLAGIYKLAMRVICFDTGIRAGIVKRILDKFEDRGKVYYDPEHAVIWVKNLRKYHETSSDKVQINIISDLEGIPDCEIKGAYIAYYSENIGYETEKNGVEIPYKDGIESVSHNKSKSKSKSKRESKKDKSPDHPIMAMLDLWGRLFPDKPQPRPETRSNISKVNTRYKSKHFRDNWRHAMVAASGSPTLRKESWFDFGFFIRNDANYQKCLDRWMAWKDEQNGGALDQDGESRLLEGV